jgi:UDP-glucose 4-epimerase
MGTISIRQCGNGGPVTQKSGKYFEGKSILITGGTGSLGKVLTRRILSGEMGTPRKVIIFSRDEAKQHFMRLAYLQRKAATEEVIFHNFERALEFVIGDVRDYGSLAAVCARADIIFNAAALKQVPSCEYFPYEAVRTNIEGAENIVRAVRELRLPVEAVIGISTDKACKPVNVMGMTKALQERVFVAANLSCPGTRWVCARYGNVLASRGSVIPLFHSQIRSGGPVTITTEDMTRFLLSLEGAVDTIFAAAEFGRPGEIFIPRIPAAKVTDVARALIGNRPIKIEITGIRPGEKVHEAMISEEEARRTVARGDYLVIRPMLPEIPQQTDEPPALDGEYSSDRFLMDYEGTLALLKRNRLMVEDLETAGGEADGEELLR